MSSDLEKILIINNDSAFTHLLQSIFSEEYFEKDFDIQIAKTYNQALQALEGDGDYHGLKEYDLIITEYHIPGGTGSQIVDLIRGEKYNNKEVPIIMVTTLDLDVIQKGEYKANEYLVKPFGIEELATKAKTLMGN